MSFSCGSFDRIVIKMTSTLEVSDVLDAIARGLLDDLSLHYVGIWLTDAAGQCEQCSQASICIDRHRCLHLKVGIGAAGAENRREPCERISLNNPGIQQIIRKRGPFSKSAVGNGEFREIGSFCSRMGFSAYTIFPLFFRDEFFGILVPCGRHGMPAPEVEHLSLFASQSAIAIKNARLFSEVDALKKRLEEENTYLREELGLQHTFGHLLGESLKFRQVLQTAKQVALTDASVLILGETGTGKELLARAIHNLSPRKNAPLVMVNCPGLTPTLIESELFGHEKGAFTGAYNRKIGKFELADRGTLFLDEIGDLPVDVQAKLLRVLQESEFERVGGTRTLKVNTRIVAATNQDLAKAIQGGRFREDLYYRLNVFPVTLPSLRERKEDLPILAEHFIECFNRQFNKNIKGLTPEALERLRSYDWPGNVRELKNLIERAVILARGPLIGPRDMLNQATEPSMPPASSLRLEDIERSHLVRVLSESDWVVEGRKGAAAKLGLNPSTLRSRLKKLGIRKSVGC